MRFTALGHEEDPVKNFNSLESAKDYVINNPNRASYVQDNDRHVMYIYLDNGEWDEELTHELADVPPGVGLMEGERPSPMYMGGSSMSGSLPNSMTSRLKGACGVDYECGCHDSQSEHCSRCN